MAIEVQHDQERRKFFVDLGDDAEASLRYRPKGEGVLEYIRTYVPESHRGEGIAEAVVLEALEHAREAGLKIVPTCDYVQHVVEEKHPGYGDLVAEDAESAEADEGGSGD